MSLLHCIATFQINCPIFLVKRYSAISVLYKHCIFSKKSFSCCDLCLKRENYDIKYYGLVYVVVMSILQIELEEQYLALSNFEILGSPEKHVSPPITFSTQIGKCPLNV